MSAEIQWEPPGRIPSWLLQHAQTANGDIPWRQPGSEGDRTRIDAALAELQERAADPVDSALAHDHRAQGVTRDHVDAPDWARCDHDANAAAFRAEAEQAAWEVAQAHADTDEAAL